MSTFVVRDTNHPKEDLARNWSAFAGGSCNGEAGGSSEESAKEEWAEHLGIEIEEVDMEFRFHPAYNEFVAVDYEGLGAFELDASSIEEAIIKANEYENDLATCVGSGDGHFYAEDCISYHKVREGRYVFVLK